MWGYLWVCGGMVVYVVFGSICRTRERVEDLAHKCLLSFQKEKVSPK